MTTYNNLFKSQLSFYNFCDILFNHSNTECLLFLQTYVRHPELHAAKSNRDYVMGEVSHAVHNIGEVAQATGPSSPHPYEGIGELAAALDEFDVRFVVKSKL